MKQVVKNSVLFLFLIIGHELKPLLIGSDIAVSVESLVNFPQIDLLNPNKILSFAWMKNGFTLQNSSTTMTFISTFPVSGTVDLAGGTLVLNQDLIFKNTTTLSGLGVITGNGYIVSLSSSITKLPSNTNSFDTVTLFFEGPLTIQSPITFKGTCVINGLTNRLTIASGGALIVGSNSSLTLRNLDLVGIKEATMYCADNTGNLVLDNISIVQDNTLTFSLGALTISHDVTIGGGNMFVYSPTLTGTILAKGTLELDAGTTFSYDPRVDSKTLLQLQDDTSSLIIQSATLHATMTGLQLTNGTIFIRGQSIFESEQQVASGSIIDRGITIGDGMTADDCILTIDNGAELLINQGTLVYNNALTASLLMENNVSRIRVNSNARLSLLQNMLLTTGQAIFEDNATLNQKGGILTGSIAPLGRLVQVNY